MIDDFNGGGRRPVRSIPSLRTRQPQTFTAPDVQTDRSEAFKTPDQVANEEVISPQTPFATDDTAQSFQNEEERSEKNHDTKPKRTVSFGKLQISLPLSRRQQVLTGLVVVLLAFGVGAGWSLTHQKRTITAETPVKKNNKVVAPAPVYSTLSGLTLTDKTLNDKSVTAVMVENSLDARPQSGLGSAGIVYEAVAEGGVTRFMALYQDTAPQNVGPIRSARPYYVSWALGYDAAYAHVGGSQDALQNIIDWKVKDMNQFSNGGSYHRISSRAAPHNVYTGIDTLNALEASKGYGKSNYTGFTRKSDGKQPVAAAGQPVPANLANSIDMNLSGYYYNPHYDYDAATNSYKRSEADAPQMDANTNNQLSPKVVVALVTPLAQGALDSSGAYYSNYNVLGSGQAYVFQDGTVTVAQWHKDTNNTSLTLTDTTGKPLALNRGQTWVTAVSAAANVTYK